MAIFGVVLFYCSAIQGLLLLAGGRIPWYTNRSHIELNEQNLPLLYHVPGLAVLVPISNDMRRLVAKQSIALPFFEHRAFAKERIRDWKPYENMERGLIPDEALTMDGAIGIPYYYLPDLKLVDTAGLVDASIARFPVHTPNFQRQMAHDRRPTRRYLEQRGVNIRVYPAVDSEARALFRARYALKVGADLWMPFDEIYGFGESVIEKFPQHALSIADSMDLEAILGRLDSPVIRSDYDVYIVDNHIVYKQDDCNDSRGGLNSTGDDLANPVPALFDETPARRFFLHVIPVNAEDLSAARLRHGFDNLDFIFVEYGRKIDGSCVAVRRLPGYDIAAIRTGEFIPLTGTHVWEDSINFVDNRSEDDIDVEDLIRYSGPLSIRSNYDVWLSGDRIVYRKTKCSPRDVEARFFLHIYPVNPDDLPDHRQLYGHDNLDFHFTESGYQRDGNCLAVRTLPDYPVSAIGTGQYTGDGIRIWEGRFDIIEQASDGGATR